MATKAKKKEKNNKNLIIGICSALVVIVVIIVAVVLATSGSNRLDDGYFVSDDSKYVISYDITQDEESDGTVNAPVKIHEVYTYEGETITGLKEYYEYADANSAKTAYDEMMASLTEEDKMEIALDGKYIVITIPAEQYENVTASDVKSQMEFIESLKNMSSENNSENTSEVVESGETVEVQENAE